MDKRQSQGKEKMGKKGKRSGEKASTGGASAPSFICSTPTERGNNQYDVFLSFRGPDTRKGFADHLYCNLVKAGIPIGVFRDKDSIPIGEEFDSQILGAITRSKISIPIISENYAASKWCLRELVHIMELEKSTPHIVLPIFYKVKPADVRRLQGKFGDAFSSSMKYFDQEEIPKYKRALEDVSYLNGWESEKIADGHEGELVQKVVDAVLRELRQDFQLDVTEHLVGIDRHVDKIRDWALSPATHARMIGIYGMGGIGKTTLAKAIYNELSKKFGGLSYIPDIRDKVDRKGIPYVQNQLIKDIWPDEREVSDVDLGISLIKSRFKYKKVLIILDDIDRMNQLNALARERDWFTAGSIIIVTTRDEAVLDQSKFGVDLKYPMNGLDEEFSLFLFNRHAFRKDGSRRDFEYTSREIISTMGGLPLALEVVGSYLFGKTDINVWKDTLKQLRQFPHEDVQAILKISYDALKLEQKEIFLDIACFFVGKKSKYAMYMWDECGFFASQGIVELKLRCLIKIGDDGELRMHDQLRDLGRSIVGEGQPLERRSRLWLYEEASTVLMEKKGTEEIQAICLAESSNHLQTYTNEQFENLPSLRFLQLRKAALSGDFNNLFSELRWLEWLDIRFNHPFTATNLHLQNLVVLKLSGGPENWGKWGLTMLIEYWGRWISMMMAAKKLKVLHLESCDYLSRTPDLSAFTELKILILKDCRNMEKVHPSIGKVKELVSLDLSDCESLTGLPREVGELKELKELILNRTGLTRIPTLIGSLRKLETLSASNCPSLREIPSSIGGLSSLKHLNLNKCVLLREIPSSIGDLQDLQYLNMDESPIRKLPSDIGRLKKLRELRLNRTRISDLPDSTQNLSSLQGLHLFGCRKLRSLPALPSALTFLSFTCQSRTLPPLSHLSNLQKLCLYCCLELESIPKLPSRLFKLCFSSCSKLMSPELDGLEYLEEIEIHSCPNVASLDLSQNNCLKRLEVKYCYSFVEIKGLDNLQPLKVIVVDGCETIPSLILPELQGLKTLCARRCDKLVEIRGLDKAKCLEVLNIIECGSMETLPDLSGCEKLQSLLVRGCKKLTQLRGLEKSNLSILDISECDALEMMPDLSGCEKLQSLLVRGCKKLTQLRGLEKSNLSILDISECDALEMMPDLSGCEKLQSLSVRDCKKLTQLRGLEKSNLSKLYISRCDALEMMPDLSGCEKLQSLSVRDCKKLTQLRGLEKSNLSKLDISECDALEMMPDLSGCEKLQSLWVRGCKKLTQFRGLEKSNLSILDISECDALEMMPDLSGCEKLQSL